MSLNFKEYLDIERERLEQARADLMQDRRLIDEKLAEVDREFSAISAYERARLGKLVPPPPSRFTGQPVRHSSRREAILQAVAASNDGMSRGDLIAAFGIKGDKNAAMSVSNALTLLKKGGILVHENKKYYLSAAGANLRQAAE